MADIRINKTWPAPTTGFSLTGIATIINNHATINAAFVAGDNTRSTRITDNTTVAHFYRIAPHATADNDTVDISILDIRAVGIRVVRSGILGTIQDSA